MKKILVYQPDHNDGIAWYRTTGPMMSMKNQIKYQFYGNDYNSIPVFTNYLDVDLVLVHRPVREVDLLFIRECRKWDLPVWLDVDDLLEETRTDNPSYYHFNNPRAKEIFAEACNLADVISVASPYLKTHFDKKELKAEVWLLPNALHDNLLRFRREYSGKPFVMWRGGLAHGEDLHEYQGPIEALANEFPKLKFIFFGMNPYWFSAPNIEYVRQFNIADYTGALTEFNSMLHIVPLKDDAFNRAKSDLAWLEGTLAGSVVLAPDFENWNSPFMTRYRNKESFFHQGAKLLTGSENYKKECVDYSWDHISKNRLLSQINILRYDLIQKFAR